MYYGFGQKPYWLHWSRHTYTFYSSWSTITPFFSVLVWCVSVCTRFNSEHSEQISLSRASFKWIVISKVYYSSISIVNFVFLVIIPNMCCHSTTIWPSTFYQNFQYFVLPFFSVLPYPYLIVVLLNIWVQMAEALSQYSNCDSNCLIAQFVSFW